MAGLKMKSSRIHSFGINSTQLPEISIRVEAYRLGLQNVYDSGDTMNDISWIERYVASQMRLKAGEHTFKYFVVEKEGREELWVFWAMKTVKNLTERFTSKNIYEY